MRLVNGIPFGIPFLVGLVIHSPVLNTKAQQTNNTTNNTNTNITSPTIPAPETLDLTDSFLCSDAQRILKAGKSGYCPLKCSHFRSGTAANADLRFVAQVLPSKTDDLCGMREVNCYPPYGVGPPGTDDWTVCHQRNETDIALHLEELIANQSTTTTSTSSTTGSSYPGTSLRELLLDRVEVPRGITPLNHTAVCEEAVQLAETVNYTTLSDSGPVGPRSTAPTKLGGWMLQNGDLGCGWGSTLGHVGPSTNSEASTLEKLGYKVADNWSTNDANDPDAASMFACCMKAMSWENSPWREGGSAVRWQWKWMNDRHKCRINRETMMRGNLDRSGGLALKDTSTCGTGPMFWRHAIGAADAANLKGETQCQKANKFEVLTPNQMPGSSASTMSAYKPVGGLPDHFTNQWGNEFPNHICPNWPYGKCRGVIGYNTIASPEECCEACVTLKWISELQGNATLNPATGLHDNPCVAWQVVGGKCRIMREEAVKTLWPNKSVLQVVSRQAGNAVGGAMHMSSDCKTAAEMGTPGSVWEVERDCNYYSALRYRETFEVVVPRVPDVTDGREFGDNMYGGAGTMGGSSSCNTTDNTNSNVTCNTTFATHGQLLPAVDLLANGTMNLLGVAEQEILAGRGFVGAAGEILDPLGLSQVVSGNKDLAANNFMAAMLQVDINAEDFTGITGNSERMGQIRNSSEAGSSSVTNPISDLEPPKSCPQIRVYTSDDILSFAADGSSVLNPNAEPWCGQGTNTTKESIFTRARSAYNSTHGDATLQSAQQLLDIDESTMPCGSSAVNNLKLKCNIGDFYLKAKTRRRRLVEEFRRRRMAAKSGSGSESSVAEDGFTAADESALRRALSLAESTAATNLIGDAGTTDANTPETNGLAILPGEEDFTAEERVLASTSSLKAVVSVDADGAGKNNVRFNSVQLKKITNGGTLVGKTVASSSSTGGNGNGGNGSGGDTGGSGGNKLPTSGASKVIGSLSVISWGAIVLQLVVGKFW